MPSRRNRRNLTRRERSRTVSGYISRRITETRMIIARHERGLRIWFGNACRILWCSSPGHAYRLSPISGARKISVPRHDLLSRRDRYLTLDFRPARRCVSIHRPPTLTGHRSAFQSPAISISSRFPRSPPTRLSCTRAYPNQTLVVQAHTHTFTHTHTLHTRARIREYDTTTIIL